MKFTFTPLSLPVGKVWLTSPCQSGVTVCVHEQLHVQQISDVVVVQHQDTLQQNHVSRGHRQRLLTPTTNTRTHTRVQGWGQIHEYSGSICICISKIPLFSPSVILAQPKNKMNRSFRIAEDMTLEELGCNKLEIVFSLMKSLKLED